MAYLIDFIFFAAINRACRRQRKFGFRGDSFEAIKGSATKEEQGI